MAFDAAFVSALCAEFSAELVGGRLERIFQCTRDSFCFEIASHGVKHRLLISAGPSGGYAYLTETNPPHPEIPPMFCMLLRKHLSGGKIKEIRQCGFERVLRFSVEFSDAFGEIKLRCLYLEAMGRNSNLILCDENEVILGALRILDLASSPDRPLITGVKYVLPPAKERSVPLTELQETAFSAAIIALPGKTPVKRALLDLVGGLSPAQIKELLADDPAGDEPALEDIDLPTLQNSLFDLKARILRGEFTYCAMLSGEEPDRKVVEYSCLPLKRYPGLEAVCFATPSELLEYVFGQRRARARLQALSERSRSILCAAIKRLERKLVAQTSDLEAAKKAGEYKLRGDLLMQNLHTIRTGTQLAVLTDYDGNAVRIPLDTKLSPAHNAQRLYDRYKKARRAESAINDQLELTRAELEYAQGVLSDLDAARDSTDLAEIAKEVSAWNYGRRFAANNAKSANPKKQKAPEIPNFMRLTSPGGFPVLVGKNNLQNEYLTFRAAAKNDLWFHIKDLPGAHVILHLEGAAEPSDEDLWFAARAALSSAQAQSGAAVDYTRVKLVKHHPSGLPGRVVYTGERSIFVRENS